MCLKESPVKEPLPKDKVESLGQKRWGLPAEKGGRDRGPGKRRFISACRPDLSREELIYGVFGEPPPPSR